MRPGRRGRWRVGTCPLRRHAGAAGRGAVHGSGREDIRPAPRGYRDTAREERGCPVRAQYTPEFENAGKTIKALRQFM